MSLKRIFDLFCCLIAIPVFGPLVVVIICLIKLDDGGRIFFRQVRIGKDGYGFICLKFRTMRDGQVTRVGKWLRMTGLDELAQVFNILAGEMSVVGPRPLTKDDITRLGWGDKHFRWSVSPGMTGLAQIHVGQGARRSLACDRFYASQKDLILDIYIVVMSLCINIIGKKYFNRVKAVLRVRRYRERHLG